MEETNIIHSVKFFISSNQLEEINIQIFTLQDQPLESFTLKNYTAHTIRLDKDITSFYCICSCTSQRIEEQFECDFSDNNRENDKIVTTKSYNYFKLKIESEIIKEYQIVTDDSSPQKQHAFLYRIAAKNIKSLENKIIKKMQLEELAKPIQVKFKKSNIKFKGPKRSKTNLLTPNFKQTCSLSKVTEKSQKGINLRGHDDSFCVDSECESKNQVLAKPNRGGAKHHTYTAIRVRMSVVSTGTFEAQQKPQPQLLEYQKIYQAVNHSLSKLNKNSIKRSRKNYGSVLEQIANQAHQELESKKQFIQAIHTAANHLRSTRTERPTAMINVRSSVNSSPRETHKPKVARIFRRRKIL